MSTAYPPNLTPEQNQLLVDADAWNAWAERYNDLALERGCVTAEQLAAERRACEQARADLLARWGTS